MTWKRSAKPSGWYPKRGDVCLFALDEERPAVVISTDALNRFSRDVCVAPISTAEHKDFSLRPWFAGEEAGLSRESWVKCDQVTTLEKSMAIYPPLGTLAPAVLARVERAIRIALELPENKS